MCFQVSRVAHILFCSWESLWSWCKKIKGGKDKNKRTPQCFWSHVLFYWSDKCKPLSLSLSRSLFFFFLDPTNTCTAVLIIVVLMHWNRMAFVPVQTFYTLWRCWSQGYVLISFFRFIICVPVVEFFGNKIILVFFFVWLFDTANW